MAESIRDLVVKLTLNTDNFSKNIQAVNRQMKEAESAFNLAANGYSNYEKTGKGRGDYISKLSRQQELQTIAVKKYEQEIAKETQTLMANQALRKTLPADIQKATQARDKEVAVLDKAKAKLEELQKASNAKTPEGQAAIKDATKAVKDQEKVVKEANKELDKLQGQYDACGRASVNSANRITSLNTRLNEAKSKLKDLTRELNIAKSGFTVFADATERIGNSFINIGKFSTNVGKTLGTMGRTMAMYVTAPIVAFGKQSIQASIDFERSFADVRKVTTATQEEFDALAESVKDMSIEVGSSTDSINAVMTTASQLGIATQDLTEFTRLMIDLGNVTTTTADAAAENLAKFVNITGMQASEYSNLANAITYTGNNFATTQDDIMQMSLRLAAAGAQVGMSEADIVGVATALSSVGIQAQMGGTAFSKALIQMQLAVVNGGGALTDFATVAGVTEEEFVKLFNNSPVDAFAAFVDGLAKMDEEGESSIAVLTDMGIKEVRLRDTILRTTNAHELFKNAVSASNQAWQDNNALAEATEVVYDTMATKIANLKNNITLLAQQIGDDLKDDVGAAADKLKGLIEQFKKLDKDTRKRIEKIAAISAAIAPILLITSKIFKLVGFFTTGIGKFFLGLSKGARALATFSANVQMLGGGLDAGLVSLSYGSGALAKFSEAALNAGGGFTGVMKVVGKSPITWLALAAAITYGAYKLIDWASGAKKAREELERLKKAADEWKNTNVETSFEKSGGLGAFGLSQDQFDVGKNNSFTAWFAEIKKVWTDGKKETNEIVDNFVGGFKERTDTIRTSMQEMRDESSNGFVNEKYLEQMDADMKELDTIDDEMAKLIKKRQNGYFTDEDYAKMQELNDRREAIVIKYKLEPEGNTEQAFETIRNGVDSALKRGASQKTAFTDSYTAATQGLTTAMDSLNTEYDSEYAKILATTEAGTKEQQEQIDALTTWYKDTKDGIVGDYNKTVKYITERTQPFENGSDYSKTISQIDELNKAIKAGDTETVTNIVGELDEKTVVEMATALSTMDAAAQTAGTTLEDISPSAAAANETLQGLLKTMSDPQYSIEQFGTDVATQLKEVFGENLSSEVYEVHAALGVDSLNESYDAWAKGEHEPIGGTVEIDDSNGYSGAKVVISNMYTDESTIYDVAAYDGLKISGISDAGETVTIDVAALTTGQQMLVTGLTDDGQRVGVNVQALDDGLMKITTIDGSESVTVNVAELDNLNGTINSILIGEGCVIPDVDVNGRVVINEPPTFGEGFTTSSMPEETFTAAKTNVTENPLGWLNSDTADRIGSISKELKNMEDASWFFPKRQAWLAATEEMGVLFTSNLGDGETFFNVASYIANGLQLISENGADAMDSESLSQFLTLYAQLIQLMGSGITNGTKDPLTGLTAAETFAKALSDTTGVEITADNLVATMQTALTTAAQNGGFDLSGEFGALGYLAGFLQTDTSATTKDFVGDVRDNIDAAQQTGSPAKYFNEPGEWGAKGYLQGFENVDPTESVNKFIAKIYASLGITPPTTVKTPTTVEPVVEGVKTEEIVNSVPDEVNTGKTVTATVKTKVEPTNTPQTVSAGTVDTSGLDGSAGVKSAGAKTTAALRQAFSATVFSGIGTQAMNGLKQGIVTGTAGVVTQIRAAATAAVLAAKSTLQIHSPSRVFRDEVGVMVMKGLGKGIEQETKAQQKVIANAMGYLSDTAKASSMIAGGNNNSRTYTDNSAVNINGNFYVRSDNDIRQLSHEIASLTRSQQIGKGVRFG